MCIRITYGWSYTYSIWLEHVFAGENYNIFRIYDPENEDQVVSPVLRMMVKIWLIYLPCGVLLLRFPQCPHSAHVQSRMSSKPPFSAVKLPDLGVASYNVAFMSQYIE